MDTLPDFSKNKSLIKARIGAAYRERKKALYLYNITVAACMAILSVGFGFFMFNKTSSKSRSGYDDFLVIELPENFSVSTSGDITLINASDMARLVNE